MPTLLKRFTLNDLPSENGTICNPVFMDGMFGYRSARPPFREDNLDKTLKLGTYKDEYEININSIENIQYSDFQDDWNKPFFISDTRLFKFKGNIYFRG